MFALFLDLVPDAILDEVFYDGGETLGSRQDFVEHWWLEEFTNYFLPAGVFTFMGGSFELAFIEIQEMRIAVIVLWLTFFTLLRIGRDQDLVFC